MLSQKEIDARNIEIDKIKEEKQKIINGKYLGIFDDYKHCYSIGQDGKISGGTVVYLKSGEVKTI